VSISGDGVRDGKLSLKSGESAQLTATVKPDNATDRKVTWTSSDSSVANVMGTGVVAAGSKAGKATVTATAGGKSSSVEVTVEAAGKQPMTVYYKAPSSWSKVTVYYRVYSSPNVTGNVEMSKACDGWWKATIPDSKGSPVGAGFTPDTKKWDDDAGKLYKASGSVMSVSGGKVSSTVPSCSVAQPMTVYYKAPSSWSKVTVYYRVYSSPNVTGNVEMSKACDGWWKATIPDSKGSPVGAGFTPDTKKWDDDAGKLYKASGDSMAVAGGQVIGDVTPNCIVSRKE